MCYKLGILFLSTIVLQSIIDTTTKKYIFTLVDFRGLYNIK